MSSNGIRPRPVSNWQPTRVQRLRRGGRRPVREAFVIAPEPSAAKDAAKTSKRKSGR